MTDRVRARRPGKRALAAQILGQTYVKAYNFILANKEAIEKIADGLSSEARSTATSSSGSSTRSV